MKAVNLIPREERRGVSRSGGGAFVLLGVLAFTVVLLTVWVFTANATKARQGHLQATTVQADRAETQAAALKPFQTFAQISQQRTNTISMLASSRFDWDQALRKVSRALPGNVWLTSMLGTVKPGLTVSADSGSDSGGDTSSLRAQLPVPAIEMVGCTTGQAQVSRLMDRLRLIQSVTHVTLATSAKQTKTAPAGGTESGGASSSSVSSGAGGASSDDCRYGNPSRPKFALVVFFGGHKPAVGAEPDVTPTGAAPAAPGSASTAPASTPPAAPGASTSTSAAAPPARP